MVIIGILLSILLSLWIVSILLSLIAFTTWIIYKISNRG